MIKNLFLFFFSLTYITSNNVFVCGDYFYAKKDIMHSSEHVSNSSDEKWHRLYVYFPHTRVVEGTTWLKGHFYSSDGKNYDSKSEFVKTFGLSDGSFSQRLMYFDVPNYSEMCYFELGPVGHSTPWSTTPLLKISGNCYFFDIITYDHFEDGSGWHIPSLKMNEFADCFLTNINEFSSSGTNGYNSYPYLATSFYKTISDYDPDNAAKIVWRDTYIDKDTNFTLKWEAIKTKYDSDGIKINTSRFQWEYIIGVFILSFAVFLLIKYFYSKRKKQ